MMTSSHVIYRETFLCIIWSPNFEFRIRQKNKIIDSFHRNFSPSLWIHLVMEHYIYNTRNIPRDTSCSMSLCHRPLFLFYICHKCRGLHQFLLVSVFRPELFCEISTNFSRIFFEFSVSFLGIFCAKDENKSRNCSKKCAKQQQRVIMTRSIRFRVANDCDGLQLTFWLPRLLSISLVLLSIIFWFPHRPVISQRNFTIFSGNLLWIFWEKSPFPSSLRQLYVSLHLPNVLFLIAVFLRLHPRLVFLYRATNFIRKRVKKSKIRKLNATFRKSTFFSKKISGRALAASWCTNSGRCLTAVAIGTSKWFI